MQKVLISVMVLLYMVMAFAAPIGERIGETRYLYQNAGPTGRRIAIGDDGSISVCWTNLQNWPYPPENRQVYYNWRTPDEQWVEDIGMQVSLYSGSGYANVDFADTDLSAIIYHEFGNALVLSIEDLPGFGIFTNHMVPNQVYPQNTEHPGICFWPQLTIDGNNRMHVLMTENTDQVPRRLAYTRSGDGGTSWLEPIIIDTLINISAGITSSPVSDRVAITFTDLVDSTSAHNYWPFYIIAEDGETWNVPGDIIMVPYQFDEHDQRWGNNNQTALFDNNDNLHLAWPAYGDSADWLLHYDTGSDTVTVIAELYGPPNHALTSPMITQVSLSRLADSPTLVATWCQFAEGDTNAIGIYNGDIYYSWSDDSGISWHNPINITNTPTPGCRSMNCSSEIYPCAPEEISLIPQFTYMFDPFVNFNDYPDTAYSVMYFDHDDLADVTEDNNSLPSAVALNQNYPNPFNANTEISYALLEAGHVNLSIFDILGRKVETLLDSYQMAGQHSVIWDAGGLPSGVYFYRLKTNNNIETRKCQLLK